MINDVQFFMCILATSISSFVKCSPLLPIFKLGWVLGVLYILDVSPLLCIYLLIFLPDVTCLFLFFFVFFSINFFFPPTLLYFIYKKIFLTCIHTYIYLFIYFWLHWVFITALGLSLVVENGGYSLAVVHRLLIMVASLVAEALGFSSCNLLALGWVDFTSCSIGAH